MDRVSHGQAHDVLADSANTSAPIKLKNSADRSLETIFNSESFRAWQRRLGEQAARDAERRERLRRAASEQVSPDTSFRSAELTRVYGTHRVVRGRVG